MIARLAFTACALPVALFAGRLYGAADRVDALIDDVTDYWQADAVWVAQQHPPLAGVALAEDAGNNGVEPAQMLAPQPVQQSRVQANRAPRLASSRRGSRTPYMIGDTVAGTCTTFAGLLLQAELSHPSLTCSRLNVSENNTPLPVDRWYFSYRHFHNAQELRIFEFTDTQNIDRFTIGGEHTFYNGLCSVEVRLPIEGRSTSDLFSDLVDDADGLNPFVGGRRAELSNISTIFKMLLYEECEWAVSAGLGITWPTAQDFRYQASIFREDIPLIDDPAFGGLVTADRDVFVDLRASNETIYLAPFLSWLYTPQASPRFFHQGFIQVEAAANPSSVHVSGDGFNTVNFPGFGLVDVTTLVPALFSEAELFAQTLMRLNLGVGYTIHDDPRASWVQRLIGLAELHYTTTLNDANFTTVQEFNFLTAFPGSAPIIQPVFIGNAANRVDILNAALGLSAEVGDFVVTNGFVAPIRGGMDRGFDFEYNLQIQRPF